MKKRIERTAISVSLLFHLIGLSGLAALSTHSQRSHPRFPGHKESIELVVSVSDAQWNPHPISVEAFKDEPLSMLIEPKEARIAKRRFVQVPTSELMTKEFAPLLADKTHLEPLGFAKAEVPDTVPSLDDVAIKTPKKNKQHQTEKIMIQNTVAHVPAAAGNTDRTPPDFSQNAPPVYPAIAIQRRWQGTVLLRLSIDAEGNVRELTVTRSSGHPVLDGAAATAVRRWKGTPAYQKGKPIPSIEFLPVRFRL